MKIGIFADNYYPFLNGLSVAVNNLASELRKKGHSAYVFVPKVGGYKNSDPNIFPLLSTGLIFSAPEVRLPIPIPNKNLRKAFSLDFDLIHAHGPGLFSMLGYQIAKLKHIPFILTFHTFLEWYTHYLFGGKILGKGSAIRGSRWIGNLADGVTTPSEKMKNTLLSYGIKKPITVIPNAIDVSFFNLPKNNFLQEKLHLPEKTPLILTVGRLGREKNFAFIIKMFKKLVEVEDEAHLVIVGKGAEMKNLMKLAGKLIDKRIHFAGEIAVKDMPLVYASASVFVFASKTEVHPLVLLEAAASGLPLVVVNDLAYENIAVDRLNSFTLPLEQEAFVEKLEEILNNRELAQQFGKESKKLISKNFNRELLTGKTISYYQEIVRKY